MGNRDNSSLYTKTQLDLFHRASLFFDIDKRTTPPPFFPEVLMNSSQTNFENMVLDSEHAKVLSIYIHIPFCDRKCNFCDLYSFHIPDRNHKVIGRYVDALISEIRLWGRLIKLKKSKISTIHFGGGSPLYLSDKDFARIFLELHENCILTKDTEIALEICTSDIHGENIEKLLKYEFSRIHIGIQTLKDEIRDILGRKEKSDAVYRKLEKLTPYGFIISADILYGLPQQSYLMFQSDIEEFINLGLDGFALYDLNQTKKMIRINAQENYKYPSSAEKFFMLLYGKEKLNSEGFENVFFNHYGNKRDKNLYFTFSIRGEDCLALGAIADGRLGSFFYRNHTLKKYLSAIDGGGLGINYAFREDYSRSIVRQIEQQLMISKISKKVIDASGAKLGTAFTGLFDFWLDVGLVKTKSPESYELTGSGCWYLSSMLEQIRRFC